MGRNEGVEMRDERGETREEIGERRGEGRRDEERGGERRNKQTCYRLMREINPSLSRQ